MRISLLAACLSSVLLGGCMHMSVTEHQFIRPDAPGAAIEKRFTGAAVSELSVTRPDGAQLNGILFTQPDARTTILYFGGNMFHVDQQASALLATLAPCGTNVAVFDYRGYGRSSGQPTVENLQGDALAMFDALDARYPGRVIAHGQSLGSFMAAHVAAARPVLATVLETTATSAADIVDAQMPWYMAPFLRLDVDASLRAVDNRGAAAGIHAPTLVIAAGKDRMTPARLGKSVFDAIPRSDKQYLFLEEAGHNDALQSARAQAAYCKFVRGV